MFAGAKIRDRGAIIYGTSSALRNWRKDAARFKAGDLHERSGELVERIGPERAKNVRPPHPKLPGKFDNAHLSVQGAQAIAPLIVKELWDIEPTSRG